MEFILIMAGGFVVYIIIQALVKAGGRSLNAKFVALGILKGRTKAEIVAAVGPPSSISQTVDGQLLQWIETGYHIALRFDRDEICLGVTHEFSAG